MKRFIGSLWPSFMITLVQMAMGSPLVLILYVVLVIMDLESLLWYIVAACAVVVYIWNIYLFCKEESHD